MKRAQTGGRGAVGHRVLTCLQTIDIGRLTTDPVFLVPGGFIAVTGQGPIDSNESSKTTFEAALSLVHGDPGWRQTSPQFSAYAAELLFNPPNAPTGSRVRTDVGFIAAVFAPTTRNDADRSDSGASGDAVTVWVRVRRHDDPAFEVALTPGLRLACGDTHAERIADATQVWASLRGPKWGPQVYARELFGPGVSCLSYVSTRGGRTEQRTSLLGSDISQLSPEQIAWQLVDLAAMRTLFDNEATQRVDFFRLSRQLKAKEQEVTKAHAAVTAYTNEADAIDRRLRLLDDAVTARDVYVADAVRRSSPISPGCATNVTPPRQKSGVLKLLSPRSASGLMPWIPPRWPAKSPAPPTNSPGPAEHGSRSRPAPSNSGSSATSSTGTLARPSTRRQPGPGVPSARCRPTTTRRDATRNRHGYAPVSPPSCATTPCNTSTRCATDTPARPGNAWTRRPVRRPRRRRSRPHRGGRPARHPAGLHRRAVARRCHRRATRRRRPAGLGGR